MITELVAEDTTLEEGKDIVLTCTAIGNPQVGFRWERDDGTVFRNEMDRVTIAEITDLEGVDGQVSQLTVEDSTPDDAGVYTCVAFNTAGEVERPLRIEVEGSTLIHINIILLSVCIYIPSPTPLPLTIFWL